jgi:hypothetical protein
MELAARGIAVDLFEARERCLTRASAQNEGKVHLGYVYANDPTLSTARTMVRGGLSFASFLRRWLGDSIDSVPVSRPFNYVVHRASLLSPRQVEAHLLACHELALEEVDGATVDYLGADPRVAPARMGRRELRDLYDPDAVSAAFRTSEVGIDPEALAGLVRDRLNDDPAIRCRLLTHVKGVERNGSGLDVEFENGAGPGRERYDQIVNALWDGRLAVDRTVGLEPPRPWMWRVKHFVRLRAPGAAVPCSTIVLGAFGDVVVYRDRDLFLSWYPAGMRDISTELEPPRWPSASEGGFSGEIRDQILDGLAAIVPAVGRLPRDADAVSVKGGVIFAWGETDIDDPDSGLHERHAIGTRSSEGYHSIDTGKLTMAPLFAQVAADRVLGLA